MHKLEVFFVAILDKSEIINRIKDLSKEQGTSLTFMYKQLGLPSGYLRDVNANKTALTEARIEAIANFLNTTPEYLKGETDIKEKTAPINEDGLSEKECELLRIFRQLSVEEQDLFLKMFHAGQE
jgi:transcriptional regulator with XRE-family HTH domain